MNEEEVMNFRIEREKIVKFDRIAKKNKRSRSKHLAWLIEKEIEAYETEKAKTL